MKQVFGSITIMVSDRQTNVAALNSLLTSAGHLIHARLGVNVEKRCTAQCSGMIILAVEAEKKEVDALIRDIKKVKGVKVGQVLFTE